MYRALSNITITQVPTIDWPKRSTVLNLDFVTEFESTDSWRDLTNKGKITIPKNLFFRDQNGKAQPLKGTNINVGGFSSSAPLFLRGDKITIVAGYKYYNKAHREIEDTAQFFEGYITKVGSKIPVELELEDNMFILKMTPVATRTFTKANTLENILSFLVKAANDLHGTNFTTRPVLSEGAQVTYLNQMVLVGSETASQVLQKLQKTFGIESYFRGNELRSGTLIYLPSEAVDNTFGFQENIIEDELEYKRKDDLTLSCVARNTITYETGEYCKDGTAKTKRRRLAVLVTIINNPLPGQSPYTALELKNGEGPPANIEGERLDFKGLLGTTIKELAAEGYAQLKKVYYTGFRGSFTTFGIPFVKQGDNAIIRDDVLPERNGKYRVKAVDYSGGINGLRQKIHIDYRLDVVNK